MRKMVGLAMLALAGLAGQASANGGFSGGSHNYSFGGKFTGFWGNGGGGAWQPQQLGPWYLYWPHEAHFQTPALPQYPYWPAPQTLSPSFGGGYGGGGGGFGGGYSVPSSGMYGAPGYGYYPNPYAAPQGGNAAPANAPGNAPKSMPFAR